MSVISDLQSAWLNLSSEDLALWQAAASFYNVGMRRSDSYLNGHTLFLKYNSIRIWAGLSILETPEFVSFVAQDCTPQVWIDTGIPSEISFPSVLVDGDKDVLIKMTKVLRPTQFKWQKYLRCIEQVLQGSSQDVQSFEMDPYYRNVFYRPYAIGDLIGVSVLQFSKLGPFMLPVQTFLVKVQTV